jgi:hypothetical protein
MNDDLIKLGFFSNCKAVTKVQRHAFVNQLKSLKDMLNIVEFHHCDNNGADEEAAIIATELGIATVSHPSYNNYCRSFHLSNVINSPLETTERDKILVDAVDFLLIAPNDSKVDIDSDIICVTNYAKQQGKYILSILSNGDLVEG